MIPQLVIPFLDDNFIYECALYEYELERESPNAYTEWGLQYIFSSTRIAKEQRRSGCTITISMRVVSKRTISRQYRLS